MSTLRQPLPQPAGNGIPLLVNGDRMKQSEFHRRYLAYPKNVKFELVGGTVYMASPLRLPHGTYHQNLSLVLGLYSAGTPGVEASIEATIILGAESEPQPDLAMRIVSECGGQSWMDEDEYLRGAPELLAEVAYSSRAIDMNQKLQDYRQEGVREYLVLCIEEQRMRWFRFPSGREIRPGRQGVSRSAIFPGLWIHEQALLDHDAPRLIAVVQQGLATKQHAAFARKLQSRRRRD